MKNVNIFKEKKQIYRLLAIAMAEDGNVSVEEEMAITTVLMYRNFHTVSRYEESRRVLQKDGLWTFVKYVGKDNNGCGNSDMFDTFKSIREKIKCHRVKLDIDGFHIKEGFSCQYLQEDIQLNQELQEDLLKSILLEQLMADTKREQYRNALLSAKKDTPEFYALKETLFAKIKEDKPVMKGVAREESCQTLEKYYESRIRPLVQEYIELCVLCLLLVRQSIEELQVDANGSVGKSVFMNVNSLTNEEKTRELKEMVYVIKSDRSMMDREREAFRVICKVFRVKGSSDLWKKLSSSDAVELLHSDAKSIRVHYKDTIMDVNDFNNIQQSICSFDVKGKITNGAFHVLQRSLMRKRDEIYFSDKKWSSLAIWTFGISSLILYFFVADLVNQTSDRPIIFKIDELQAFPGNITKWMRWGVCSFGIVLVDWLLVRKFNLKKSIVFFSTVFIVFLLLSIHHLFSVKWNDMLETFFIPFILVAMMLSIEWLIFMRQEYSGHTHDNKEQKDRRKGNASILIVLVCAAIMIDVCLGIVELIAHSESPDTMDYVAKIASALILGCICFFAGKFLDMYRVQQLTDVVKMDECTERIGELQSLN